MHISDGVLPPAVWLGGMAAAAASVGISLRRFDERAVPRLAVLTSIFFVASLVHVPLGLTSVHLMLNGLTGIVLGPLALPAILVGLFFQAVFLGHGGVTSLGVNTIVLGSGALAARCLFIISSGSGTSPRRAAASAFAAALAGVAVSAALFFAAMALGGESLARVAAIVLLPQIVVAVIDGAVTASAVGFLARVKPELLPGRARPVPRPEMPLRPGAGAPLRALAVLAGLACVLAPDEALAHSLRATARPDGDEVVVLVFYSDRTPAASARVRVSASRGSGDVIAQGSTNAEGKFRFPCPRAADLVAVIDDGAGHRVELVIPAALCRGAGGPAEEVHSEQAPLGWMGNTWWRAAAGIGAILLLAGLAMFIIRARPRTPS